MAVRNVPTESIREAIACAIASNVKSYNVPDVCARLGIQATVEAEDATEANQSKRLYVKKRLQSWQKPELLGLAGRLLEDYPSEELTDIVNESAVRAGERVTELVRRDALKSLNSLRPLFGEFDLIDSLSEIFGAKLIKDNELGLLGRLSFQWQIDRNCVRNDNWSNEDLLIQCGVLTCTQSKFFALLEKLLHPVSRRDGSQAALAGDLSQILRRDGYEIQQTAAESGYPIYSVVRKNSGVGGSIKNLIFASVGAKPELVFRDAINNDVEITKHADKVLVFDRPLPSSGLLLWSDLRSWWADTHGVSDSDEAKKQLYRRLLRAVRASGSPGELAVFTSYYELYGAMLGDKLPALIPQVYLHYDPYTKRQRGDDQVLPRQRMDLLLLLEQGVRVVIEVDGRHHYGNEDSTCSTRYLASPDKYAEMAREDRSLRLRGYEVYRFGANEFHDVDLEQRRVGPGARHCVKEFFDQLLTRHRVLQ